jgi:hypothetical protein
MLVVAGAVAEMVVADDVVDDVAAVVPAQLPCDEPRLSCANRSRCLQ